MSIAEQVDPMPALTSSLTTHLPEVHILISDGHYTMAGAQLSRTIQAEVLNEDAIDRAATAADEARCPHREGPFGGYDYGHNNRAPIEGGRYVIRDFRDPTSPEWGKWIHQTDCQEEHDKAFKRMTDEHVIRAIVKSIFAGPSNAA